MPIDVDDIENGIVDVPATVDEKSNGLDSEELLEFLHYLTGDSLEPPTVVNKMMNNLLNKLSVGLGMQMVSSSGRIASMQKFLSVAENRLFDPAKIANMDDDELAKAYRTAAKVSNDLFEQQRKFIVQNQELFKIDSTPQEKLVSRLMSLSPDKLDTVLDKIDDILGDSEPEVSDVEAEIIDS